ncbi:unnamed protein product [marine sediment metagenome]|uniref:Uncharacterized protein n=1 Tax=marine sediment metagenome TaxID=412755 RepID=X1H8K5_9ZZZZ
MSPVEFYEHPSKSAAGTVYVYHNLGIGKYNLHAGSVDTAVGEAIVAVLGYKHTLGDDTEETIILKTGYIKQFGGLTFLGPFELLGPGRVYAACVHMDAGVHHLQLQLERMY